MKGYLNVHKTGNEIKSSVYWSSIIDTFLNFYKDKQSQLPIEVINLDGCDVSSGFSEKFNTNVIQIQTKHNQKFLLVPDDARDFDKWETTLVGLSSGGTDKIRPAKVNPVSSGPSYPTNATERRQRYIHENTDGNRREDAVKNPKTQSRDLSDYPRKHKSSISKDNPISSDRPDSNVPVRQKRRVISTVKEDPMMSDEEILETKPLDELRKRYPVSDKTKRWSIAASDIVGKSNDELFIMLIQLNREKSHMDIWKIALENEVSKIDQALKSDTSNEDKQILLNNRDYVLEQLNEIDYMINLAHPLISFLQSVVQMSDVYQGDNQTFHVIYHQHPPSGKEDFTNINFIRHNQEREVARLINEDKNQNQSPNIQFNSMRSVRLESRPGKENDPELALSLKTSQKYIDKKNGLTEVLEDIESQLLELDPMKVSVETFFEEFNLKENDSKVSQMPTSMSTASLKSLKSQKKNEVKPNDLSMMPRRSTRKAPASDMLASINRSEKLANQSKSLNRTDNSVKYNKQHSLPKNYISANSDYNVAGKQTSPNIRPDISVPITYKSSPSLKEKHVRQKDQFFMQNDSDNESQDQSEIQERDYQPPLVKNRKPNNANLFDIQDGPLIKLNVNRYQNPSRNSNPKSNGKLEYNSDNRSSISNSDISVSSTLINQRMNLNESFNNNKNWKNPGRSYNPSEFSTPPKVEIRDRYRASVSTESDVDYKRSDKIRQQVVKESMARYSEDEVGKRNERENLLLKNSLLAQEASRRSRQL